MRNRKLPVGVYSTIMTSLMNVNPYIMSQIKQKKHMFWKVENPVSTQICVRRDTAAEHTATTWCLHVNFTTLYI